VVPPTTAISFINDWRASKDWLRELAPKQLTIWWETPILWPPSRNPYSPNTPMRCTVLPESQVSQALLDRRDHPDHRGLLVQQANLETQVSLVQPAPKASRARPGRKETLVNQDRLANFPPARLWRSTSKADVQTGGHHLSTV
jgi:hypothetical protein